MSTVDENATDARMAIAANEIDQLRAELEQVTKERDEARDKWDGTINEIWTSDLQGKIAGLTKERDDARAELESRQRWIPVSERLPHPNPYVCRLVFLKEVNGFRAEQKVAEYLPKGRWALPEYEHELVTHWMSLPEAPKL
jgi:hypothetical protein